MEFIIGFACTTWWIFCHVSITEVYFGNRGGKLLLSILCKKVEQFLLRVDLLSPVPARGFFSCQLRWIDVAEHRAVGTETNRKENKLGGSGLSPFALLLFILHWLWSSLIPNQLGQVPKPAEN